ncbi:hypothetical protein SARC_10818 [Sphaeroforma arctica JP610]|uniref:Activator of Hsp90 ATPase AHSA1-like N-terminal domain-containing protein n=1 Tax=Sphaeroforma arctica JP610 TaxID=667725 RepID=A0A0L0FJQ5_9EUKA|nr:hypothetical protein SARC_10818 [Sphaeroforma arctica JP610]KNC76696.1 hypothetical protein SARC_10818 [Sphaeroforma arctica JP610]|eukprot:XP_014150598.1 hypothetical protein SARC_10818 [Sphaeroforma arctica JP610]
MAKWGEGDARWIVEERPDSTNVNNWHWSEKNCTPWSKKRIGELFNGTMLFTDPLADVVCGTDITVTGEATASNRKGKLIFFYELEVKSSWSTTSIDGVKVEGEFEIPNLSEENDLDEIDVQVTVKNETNESRSIKDLMRTKGKKAIIELLGKWLKDLKNEYSTNLIKPTLTKEKLAQQALSSPASINNTPDTHTKPAAKQGQNGTGGTGATTTIDVKAEFKCSAADAYSVFTDPQKVQAWVQSPITMVPKVGEKWALFGGNVTGEFLELEPAKLIKQKWRFASWNGTHHSEVTITFAQGSSSTAVVINQSGVPKAEADKTKDGWKQNYLKRINSVFGYGADFGEF